jgi:hypothetical protein
MVNPEDQNMNSFIQFHRAKTEVKLPLNMPWKQMGSGGVVLIDCNMTECSIIYVQKATVSIYLFKKLYSMETDQNKD